MCLRDQAAERVDELHDGGDHALDRWVELRQQIMQLGDHLPACTYVYWSLGDHLPACTYVYWSYARVQTPIHPHPRPRPHTRP